MIYHRSNLRFLIIHWPITRLAVLVALVAILLGPWYTDPGYNWVRHSVSELAAQHTRNAWVMQIGLFALGAGVAVDFLRSRHPADLPFLAFGIFIAASAFVPHRPFVEGQSFNRALDIGHSVLASLAGFSAVLGFIVRSIAARQPLRKGIYVSIAAAYTVLPLMMAIYPPTAGVFQRTIFLSFSLWAVVDYPIAGPVEEVSTNRILK